MDELNKFRDTHVSGAGRVLGLVDPAASSSWNSKELKCSMASCP